MIEFTDGASAEKWLQQNVEWAVAEPFCSNAILNEPMAAALLKRNNAKNRKPSEAHIASIAKEMSAGRWMYNGQGAIIDTDGEMMTGQHRCLAAIRSGVSFPFPIQFGVDPAARSTIDIQKRFSAGDGFGFDRHAEACIRSVFPKRQGRNPLRRDEINTAYLSIREEVEYANKLVSKARFNRSAVRAAFVRALAATGEAAVLAKFYNELIGKAQTPSTQAFQLAMRIQGAASPFDDLYWLTEHALRASLDGRNLRSLPSAREELFPFERQALLEIESGR